MSLPTIDPLAAVVTMNATEFRRFYGLRVDGASARSLFSSGSHADLLAQGIDQTLPGAVIPPAQEVVIDSTLGQQVMRQHVPLAARAVLIEQGIEYLTHADRTGPPACLGWRDQ